MGLTQAQAEARQRVVDALAEQDASIGDPDRAMIADAEVTDAATALVAALTDRTSEAAHLNDAGDDTDGVDPRYQDETLAQYRARVPD